MDFFEIEGASSTAIASCSGGESMGEGSSCCKVTNVSIDAVDARRSMVRLLLRWYQEDHQREDVWMSKSHLSFKLKFRELCPNLIWSSSLFKILFVFSPYCNTTTKCLLYDCLPIYRGDLLTVQRGFTNPAPKTESAREAVRSFYCQCAPRPPIPPLVPKLTLPGELCSKGYARMNEYDAHLSSYDHSHKQRLKDMRQLTRDPLASSKARKAEAKANSQSGLISIKLGESGGTSGGGGFKKSGFKKSGFKSAFAPVDGEATKEEEQIEAKQDSITPGGLRIVDEGESDTEDEGYEMYDPRHPTD